MVFVGNEDHNWLGPWKELNLHHISDIQAARDTFAINLCAVAALTWVLYDFILCFEQEVSLVWWRWREHKGRHARRIYVVVRYFSFLSLAWYVGINTRENLSHSAWHYIVLVNASVITLLPDVIAIIRINAVYGWDYNILLICISLFFIQVTTSLGIGALAISGVRHTYTSSPNLGCPLGSSKYRPMIALAALIPSVAAQGVYLLMMLIKFVHVLQDLDSNGKASAESLLQVRRLVPTMIVFISNGSVYFFIAIGYIVAKVVNAIILVSVSRPLRGIGIPIMMALYPVLVARTYLSMVAYLHPELGDTGGGNQDRMIVSSPSTLIRPRIGSGQITFAVRSSFAPEPDEEER